MRTLLLAATPLLLLVGCGAIPPSVVSGEQLITHHARARAAHAIEGAQTYCAARGKNFKLIRTDCPAQCVSTFECVSR
jgi:uncharacterized protein YcfL